MGAMEDAITAELLAEAVMSSVGWLQRAARRKPDQTGHAPLDRNEIDLLRPIIADYISDSLDLDAIWVDGVEAYMFSRDFRLLLDHLIACLLLDHHVESDGALARMCATSLRQFVSDDQVSEAFETSFFAVLVSACRTIVDAYLPEDYRPSERSVDQAYLKQLHMYVAVIEDHLHSLVSRDIPTRRDYEQFFTKALRITRQASSRVVPPSFDGSRPIAIDRIYVTPRLKVSVAPRDRTLSFDVFVDSLSRAVVLGDPGAGKSTLAQKLSFDLASMSLEQPDNRTVDHRMLPIIPRATIADTRSRRRIPDIPSLREDTWRHHQSSARRGAN